MEDLTKYEKHYSDNEFWKKLKVVARKAGLKVVYAALLLVYLVKSPLTSKKDKGKILGAQGYFILPIDVIPDWIPVAGYTDDLAALTWAIYSVAKNVTPEVKQQAKAKLKELFGEYDEKDLQGLL